MLYRAAVSSSGEHGPFGELVRDVLLRPALTSSHDYLRTSERAEDIAIEARERFGVDLAARFARASRSCLVKFRSFEVDSHALETALVYGWQMLTEGAISGRGPCRGYGGEGVPVPPENMLDVEVVRR